MSRIKQTAKSIGATSATVRSLRTVLGLKRGLMPSGGSVLLPDAAARVFLWKRP